MIRYLVSFIIIATIATTGLLIHAQEELSSESSGVTFEQLQSDYLFQLEQYRKAETRFNLDKAEFTKLQTLASREKAVESMRPYLDARAHVLSTYLRALQFLLNQAQGIDISDKNATLDKHEQAQSYIANFRSQIPSLVDRDSANKASSTFEQQGLPLIFEVQYRTLTLLAIGRVQRVYDQYELALQEFKTDYFEPIPDEGKKAQIERGLKDVDFHAQAADVLLQQIVKDFPPFLTPEDLETEKRNPNFQTNYTTTVSELQKVSGSIRTSLRFLTELERQV